MFERNCPVIPKCGENETFFNNLIFEKNCANELESKLGPGKVADLFTFIFGFFLLLRGRVTHNQNVDFKQPI